MHASVSVTREPIEMYWDLGRAIVQRQKRERWGSAARQITSFDHTLSADQSARARKILKDPYNFGFLAIAEQVRERDIETALIQHMRQFLLELGLGFMFAGSQYRLVVGGEDFYLDLLFIITSFDASSSSS